METKRSNAERKTKEHLDKVCWKRARKKAGWKSWSVAKAEACNGGRVRWTIWRLYADHDDSWLEVLKLLQCFTYSMCFTLVASLRCLKYLKDLTWGAVLTECALLSWDPSPTWAALVSWDISITRGTWLTRRALPSLDTLLASGTLLILGAFVTWDPSLFYGTLLASGSVFSSGSLFTWGVFLSSCALLTWVAFPTWGSFRSFFLHVPYFRLFTYLRCLTLRNRCRCWF